MTHGCLRLSLLLLCAASLTSFAASAQENNEANALMARVADALGGRQAILDIHSLQADGYGMEAYFWGGGNVTGDPEAPQKWAENPAVSTIWDFDNDRYLTQYRHNFLFPFGGIFGHSFALSGWGYDGNVGYTVTANGNGQRLADWTTSGAWFKPDGTVYRRYEAMSHPLAAVRAVLSGAARPQNLRIENGLQVVDLVIAAGRVTAGIDPASLLPRWVRWILPHQNLGQLVMTTTFSGYQDWDGVQLPFAWSSRIDWRDTQIQTRLLDAYYINSDRTPNIAAAPSIRSQALPRDTGTTSPITATVVADGIWHLNPGGNTVVEFADHMLMFELSGDTRSAKTAIAVADTLVPGKKLTHLIVSHHHFDHTRGFRAAIEAGLTIISHRGNAGILHDMASRPAPNFGDLVLLPDGGRMDFVPVDGHLRLQDDSMTLDIYAVVKHNHMANAVFAYAPDSKTFIEADLATPANQFSFWAEAYEDNLEHYGLEVTMVSPNHVNHPMTHQETLQWIAAGVPNALARCEEYAARGRNLPGCPPYIYRDWSERLLRE